MNNKNIIWFYPFIAMCFLLILTNSCKKNDDNTSKGLVPMLTTNTVNDITQTTANCGGNITSDGGSTITARGVCWSTGQTPTISDFKTTDGSSIGIFTSAITGLGAETTYYVRAYATNSNGTGYGNVISFMTQLEVGATVTDIEGTIYQIVQIGTQVWMAENLKTTKYNNGIAIPYVTDGGIWGNLTSPGYCWYNYQSTYGNTYGALYNWYAVNTDSLCPTGWHVPTQVEWTTLTDHLGGTSIAGGKLKEIGTTHWNSPNTGATNESGFTALPGGYRSLYGTFDLLGSYGSWWSATDNGSPVAWSRDIYNNNSNIDNYTSNQKDGFSVRCIRNH